MSGVPWLPVPTHVIEDAHWDDDAGKEEKKIIRRNL